MEKARNPLKDCHHLCDKIILANAKIIHVHLRQIYIRSKYLLKINRSDKAETEDKKRDKTNTNLALHFSSAVECVLRV